MLVASSASLWATWCTIHHAWFGEIKLVLLLSPESILAVSASSKASGYKSFPASVSKAKILVARRLRSGPSARPPRSSGERASHARVLCSKWTRQSRSHATSWTFQEIHFSIIKLENEVAFAVISHVMIARCVSLKLPVSKKDPEQWCVFALSAVVAATTSKLRTPVHTMPWWRSSPVSVFISATRCRPIYRSSLRARDARWTRLWSFRNSPTRQGPSAGRHTQAKEKMPSRGRSLRVTGARLVATLGVRGKKYWS